MYEKKHPGATVDEVISFALESPVEQTGEFKDDDEFGAYALTLYLMLAYLIHYGVLILVKDWIFLNKLPSLLRKNSKTKSLISFSFNPRSEKYSLYLESHKYILTKSLGSLKALPIVYYHAVHIYHNGIRLFDCFNGGG
jgi:hypothetical protein